LSRKLASGSWFPLALSNIIGGICHVLFCLLPPSAALAQPSRTRPPLGPDEVEIEAVQQIKQGSWYRLRGRARLETAELVLRADELDYNEETGYAEARGNVHLLRYATGEELWAERAEYELREESGRFFGVRGTAPAPQVIRPGVLPTTNPYYFEGRWAERFRGRYLLYDGFLTNCRLPKPWWVLRSPRFEIRPGKSAMAWRSTFRLRGIPLLYAPFFYKSLERLPRRSGLLTPNVGNSSRRGKMLGAGYYQTLGRSYDAMYRMLYFTQRGVAHHVEVRGKPRGGTEFNAILYGVNDRGLKLPGGERRKEGGLTFSLEGQTRIGSFEGRGEANYLSSLVFRQAFTESFNEAIFSEVHSIGFLGKHWSSFGLNFVFQRLENFQSTQPDDTIVIRKAPQVEFSSRPRQAWSRGLPVWISLESSVGLVRRKQPLFQTRQFLERADVEPRLMTALRWKDFHLIPSFSLRGTHWGESWQANRVTGVNIRRQAREFALAVEAPSLARIFRAPRWLGDQLKHVIEPRASFRWVGGVKNFDRLLRFDDIELLANTRQAEISLTHRFYVKRRGEVSELASWELVQQRYFDPAFGGAVQPGRRNLVMSSAELTGYAFLDGPRGYSPVISALRLNPRPGFGMEWRADYDPLRGKLVNNGLTADARWSKYVVSLGHNSVRNHPILTPGANQLRGLVGYGNPDARGFSAAFSAIYDFRFGLMQFATTQITYNTDCCGWSIQYRRFGFGTRNENQFRLSFAVANIGSFGTLKKQERLF